MAANKNPRISQTETPKCLGTGPEKSTTRVECTKEIDLTDEHRNYLLQRHGTIDLVPLPSADPADPYNWPVWKKSINLFLVSFHALMTTFIAAAIIPSFEDISKDLGTSIKSVSYLTSLQIAILGWSSLFWRPISHRYGRRPVWLISTLGATLFNVGCALSPTYAAMAVCRAFVAFFISPAIAIGSGVVTEIFFQKQRAQYMGVWTLLVTLGPPTGPFIMGFVAQNTGSYRWIYWVIAITNGVQFLTYFLFATETRYIRTPSTPHDPTPKLWKTYLSFHRLDPTPIRLIDFFQPLTLVRYASILIPSIAYAIVFGFCGVLVAVEIPQLFVPKFGFDPQQLGLQFLGVIIGSIVGEQIGGRLSDFWMNRRSAQGPDGRRPPPEYRLWLSYGGFVLAMVGLIVFGVRFEQAPVGKWNVTPIIGIAIAAAGNQIITTVLVTYAVDCHVEHSANIGVFVSIIRSTWGFIGPFWFPNMLSALGGSGSGGLMAGMIFLFSLLPIAVLQWHRFTRRSQSHKEHPAV